MEAAVAHFEQHREKVGEALPGYPSSAFPLSPTSRVRLSRSQPMMKTVERALMQRLAQGAEVACRIDQHGGSPGPLRDARCCAFGARYHDGLLMDIGLELLRHDAPSQRASG